MLGQTVQIGVVALQFIRLDDADARMRFGHLDRAADAVRENLVVWLDHFAISALWRNSSEREIVVL